jgi:hypothetical protein
MTLPPTRRKFVYYIRATYDELKAKGVEFQERDLGRARHFEGQ